MKAQLELILTLPVRLQIERKKLRIFGVTSSSLLFLMRTNPLHVADAQNVATQESGRKEAENCHFPAMLMQKEHFLHVRNEKLQHQKRLPKARKCMHRGDWGGDLTSRAEMHCA